MTQVTSKAQSIDPRGKFSRFNALFILFLLVSTATGASAESLSLSLGGARMDFVWVPVEGSDGFKQVEIGDFDGPRVKEKKRLKKVYVPFECNSQRGYYLGKAEVSQEQWAAVM